MATQTVGMTSPAQSSTTYGNPNNACDDSTSTYATHVNVFGSAPNGNIVINTDSWSLPVGATITAFEVRIYAYQNGTVTESYQVNTNTSGFCAGHGMSFPSTAAWTSWVACTHTANYPNTRDEANNGDIEIKVITNSLASNKTVRVYAVQARITYTVTTVPPAPPDPSIVNQSSKTLRVTSADTNGYGGGTANDVEHQISTTSDFSAGVTSWTKGSAATSPNQTHDFTVLPDTLYYARARYSSSENGWGAYNTSPYNSVTSWDTPNLPTALTSTTQTSSSVSLSWTAPSDNGGEGIDTYHVMHRLYHQDPPRKSTDMEFWYKLDNNANDSSPNARNGTNYGVDFNLIPTVGKIREGGQWIDGNTDYILTPSFAPTGDCISISVWLYHDGVGNESIIGDAAQNNTVGFIWSYITGTNINYQYARVGSTNATTTAWSILSGYTNTWVNIIITADYNLKEVKYYRNGILHTTVAMTGTPSYPSTVRVKYIGEYSASHSWDYNGYMDDFIMWGGTTPLTQAEVDDIYERGYTDTNTASTSTSYTKGSLSAGTKYEFYVHAVNLVGEGDNSTEYLRWTLPTTPIAPVVTATGVGELTVNWSASNSTGVDQWDVEQSPDGTTGWTNILGNPHASGSTSQIITGLANAEDYFYRLRSRNPDTNYTPYSTNGSATTLAVPEAGDPQSVIVPDETSGTLRIEQSNPLPTNNGFAITHWQVWSTSVSSGSQSLTNYGTGTPTGTGWSNNSNATGAADSSCANQIVPNGVGDYLQIDLPSLNISDEATIDSVTVGLKAIGDTLIDTSNYDVKIVVKDPDGSTYCSGHSTTGITTEGGCSDSVWRSYTCSHWTWTPTNLKNSLKVRFNFKNNKIISLAGTLDAVRMIVNYSDAYADLSGDILIGTTTYDATTNHDSGLLGNNNTQYYKLKFKNSAGYSALSDNELSEATPDVPDAQDVDSVTTPYPSMLRITRNATLPPDNREDIDSWSVWRSNLAFGTYVKISSDISTSLTAYDDWTVKGGETWYYKLKFKNFVGDSALGGYRFDTATYAQLFKPSNLRIVVTRQLTLSSNLRIKVTDNQLFKPSNFRVKVTNNQLFQPSKMKVIIEGLETQPTNLRVKVLGQQTSLSSQLNINNTETQDAQSATTPYDSMIRITRETTPPSGAVFWSVWRSATDSGNYSYSNISGNLDANLFPVWTYDDWSVNGGETWYYKLKFIFLIWSPLSDNAVSTTAVFAQLIQPSDLRILLTSQLSKPSSLRILTTSQLSKPSDLRIKVLGQQIFSLSNLRIKTFNDQLFKSTNLTIIIKRSVLQSSNLGVKVFGQQKSISSNLRINDPNTTQDAQSATTPYDSMIRITRETTPPAGSALWQVWRSATDSGNDTYSNISGNLNILFSPVWTYDDWTAKGGETWYYKLKFSFLIWSPLSDNAVSTTAVFAQLIQPSDLRILLTSQLSKPSSLRILTTSQLSKPSDLRIKVLNQQKLLSSNVDIRILNQQLFKSTNLKVVILDQEIILVSNLRIRVANNLLSLSSNLVVQIPNLQIIISSNLRVLVTDAPFTPSVTFTRYELNDVATPTTDTGVYFGMWEGTKTINLVAIDPYENTMTNADKHEFIYAVSPRSGSENFFQNPLSNGLVDSNGVAEDGLRTMGFDQQTWVGGITELISLVDVEGDWAGSGARVNLTGTWSNSGTVWSPPTGSGSNVIDVPRIYNGSMIVVVQPSDWDSNFDHKLHDWLPFQVNAGHAVEVSGFSFISGTHENSIINAQGNLNTAYDMSFRVYHEVAKEWEWYSGSTLLDNGVITPVKNTWQFINNLSLPSRSLSGSVPYELRLYTDGGNILHPNPIRIITVNMII